MERIKREMNQPRLYWYMGSTPACMGGGRGRGGWVGAWLLPSLRQHVHRYLMAG